MELASRNTVFTLFVPDDGALDYLSDDDIAYINDNISYTERHQVFIYTESCLKKPLKNRHNKGLKAIRYLKAA